MDQRSSSFWRSGVDPVRKVGPSLFREAAKIGSIRLVSGGMEPIFLILRHRALVLVPLDDTSVWMEQWWSSFGCFEKISFFCMTDWFLSSCDNLFIWRRLEL